MALIPGQIVQLAARINIAVSVNQAGQLADFGQLLLRWNEDVNLTAITGEQDLMLKHLVDSLTVLLVCPANASYARWRVLDVGTGGGMPGIPLKIVRPDFEVDLLDSTGKKIVFCEAAIQALGLTSIRAIHGRAEELAHRSEFRECYDLIVARAVAPLCTLVEYLLPFVRLGGMCVAMKGSRAEIEIESARKAIQVLGGDPPELHPVSLPGLDDRRALVVVNKARPTPRQYPRQTGAPRLKPIA